MVRLQKYISECGYTSRRKAEELIASGRVTVNGKVASIGQTVNENNAEVKIDGKLIKNTEKKVYIMLNKPKGYLSTVSDDRGRKTVMELLNGVEERVFPVGRLDYDTEGLLLLTNDGDFTYKVTHPGHQIKKTYLVILKKEISDEDVLKLKEGVTIENYVAKADKISVDNERRIKVVITISQGKNRQVRKMFEAVGNEVKRLKRLSIGKLELEGVRKGMWKYLDEKEVGKVLKEK